MTVVVDLAEFLTAYIAEVDEQLETATAKLLKLDAAARRGERDPRTLRDLFRAMHTIKGLSSMVSVEPVVAVAHRMEAVLRDADRAGGQLAPQHNDVLLQGLRLIEQCVRVVEKGQTPPDPAPALLQALEAISPAEAAPAGVRGARLTLDPALEAKLDAFERDLLLKGATEGRRALRIDYEPTASGAARGVNINAFRERAAAVAEIVRVVPVSLPPSKGAPSRIAFALLVLTSQTDTELVAALGIEPSAIQSIVALPVDTASVLPPAEDGLALEPTADAPRRNLLRVDASRVDDAMDRLATLIVTRSKLSRAIERLAASGADTRELAQIAGENARQLRDLRTSILQVRMVPLLDILERIPLLLRSLMRASGRQVRLEVEAAGAELDKAVAERVFPAIVHLVRNAVDHGVEAPEDRVRAGKPPEGVIRIACSARSNTRLELGIEDDGGGVDPEAVARRAGVAKPETDAALLELLCQPGFSTRDEATTTSGRGLGMDIVKRIVVDQLGGELAMNTRRGAGTTFTVQIPLTVAIVDAFVVECAGQRFAVPVSVVEEILEIGDDRGVAPPFGAATSTDTRPVGLIERRGETLPLYSLGALLGLPDPGGERRAIVVRRAGEPLGFLLARVVSQQEAVVRPLIDPLVRVIGVSAATDLGDGRPTIVLDLAALVGQRPRPARPALPSVSSPRALPGGPAPRPGDRP